MDIGTPLIVAFPMDDERRSHLASVLPIEDDDDAWNTVDTGLRGHFIADSNEFVIPIQDEMTAEELARILTGTFKRARG